MKDWISLFEKYRIDRQLHSLYCHEYLTLSQSSPRKAALEADIDRLEQSIYSAELLLAHYDSIVTSPKDALRRAEERLFLACHYINGLSMEATAFAMNVSRDTIYRIRRRIVARGEISPEFYQFCREHLQSILEEQNARLRVEGTQAIREACFAGKISLTPDPSLPLPRRSSATTGSFFSTK